MQYQDFNSDISEKTLAEKIAKGLGGWLMYEHHSYRADLFSEKYLTHGLGNLLAGNTRDKVIAEFNHPILKTRKQGRPPQIDFVILNEKDEISLAVESKWVGTKKTSTPSLSDILWDLIRLESLSHKYNTKCVFILAGKKSQIDKVLSSNGFVVKHKGKNIPLLPTNGHELILDILNTAHTRLADLEKNLKRYTKVEISSKMRITAFKKYPKDCHNFENQVCVWSITSIDCLRFKHSDLAEIVSKNSQRT